jgi:hypothetical protein
VFAVVLVMLVSFAGCGSGSSSSLSEEDYMQEVRLVCNQGLKEREELINQINRDYYEKREQATNTKYQVENLRKLIGLYQKTTEELADVGLPEGGEKKAEEMLRAREEAAAKVQASPLGTRDSLEVVFKDANDRAEAYGLKTCVL